MSKSNTSLKELYVLHYNQNEMGKEIFFSELTTSSITTGWPLSILTWASILVPIIPSKLLGPASGLSVS